MSKDVSLQTDNSAVTEANRLINLAINGGDWSPIYFRELVQHLLSQTIVDSTSFVRITYSKESNISYIHGPERSASESRNSVKGNKPYSPLKLNDGNFLYLYYENFIDRDDNDWLKTNVTKMAYQFDEGGYQQLFRFDYNRLVRDKYPASHLHVYGKWDANRKTDKLKDLPNIHFPIVRPTIEGIIRLLVDDFGVDTHTSRTIWEPMLDMTEQRFKEIMSKRKHKAEQKFDQAM
jgi:hypothetical protein